MTKIIALAVGSLLLAAALFCGFNKIVALEKTNATLTKDLKDAKETLISEVERSDKVEKATQQLEENDAARQKTLRSFERRLNTASKNDAKLQSVLATVISDELLVGLRSFQRGNATAQQRPSTGALPGATPN